MVRVISMKDFEGDLSDDEGPGTCTGDAYYFYDPNATSPAGPGPVAVSTKEISMKWHGGKSSLSGWLWSLMPRSGHTHRNIVFAGGLGEFWPWPHEGVSECINDLDTEVMNFYEVLRNEVLYDSFRRRISLMPLSREEWELSTVSGGPECSPVGRAVDFMVKYQQSRQGLGVDYVTPTKRLRRSMNEHVSAWLSSVDGLEEMVERLRRVELENVDFERFIKMRDHEAAFFYLDPPYVEEKRVAGRYMFEMDTADHQRLLECLTSIRGKFMLSGYTNSLYTRYAQGWGWNVHTKTVSCSSSSKKIKETRIEAVWTNY